MRWFIGIIVVMGALFMLAPSAKDTAGSTAKNHTITTIRSDVETGGQLLDVRTKAEFESGHIKDAVNLPVQNIQAGVLPEVAKDKPVYVYCQSGNRSAQATAALKKAGYTNIIDLGAMTNVQKMGGTVAFKDKL